MERIAAILVVFVLLMNGRHVEHRLPIVAADIQVEARAIPLDPGDPQQRDAGELRYLSGWDLTSSQAHFGGISSMYFRPDGTLVTLNDGGELAIFRPGTGRLEARFMPVPITPSERGKPIWLWDSESITRDPVRGTNWVGYEQVARICRYTPDFSRVERCIQRKSWENWPITTGMESLQRLPDGRFIAISELAKGPFGVSDALLFSGDPVDPRTPDAVHFSYRPPQGYLPTDSLWLGNGRMLVLNRRVTLLDGFTAVLTLVDVGAPREGEIISGRVVAQFARPFVHDNFEALALRFDHGRPELWIASDDNHLFFERSYLLRFAMPPEWLKSDRSGEEKQQAK